MLMPASATARASVAASPARLSPCTSSAGRPDSPSPASRAADVPRLPLTGNTSMIALPPMWYPMTTWRLGPERRSGSSVCASIPRRFGTSRRHHAIFFTDRAMIDLPSNGCECRVESVGENVDVVFRGDQRRSEADDVAEEATLADQNAAPARLLEHAQDRFRCWRFRLAIFHTLDGLHEAHPADIADHFVFVLEFLQTLAEISAHHGRVARHILLFDITDRGQRGCRGHRIPAERGEGETGKRFWDLVGRRCACDRCAVGQS